MTTAEKDYWEEGIAQSAEECGLVMTKEQLAHLVEAVAGAHENYGMAFYSPPASDRYDEIEREYKAKIAALERASERYRDNAEKAVKRALRQQDDANVSIGEYGEVFRHGGRTEQIQ